MFSGEIPLMRDKLAALAGEIRGSYDSIRGIAASARSADPALVVKVRKADVSLRVCAVDGGLLAGRMHGADIVVVRAVAAVFDYQGSLLKANSYHPEKCPQPQIEIKNSLEEHEALLFRSLLRLHHELSCAISALDAHNPGLLLIDGSLLPLPSDRPSDGSELRPLYDDVLSLYRRLYLLSGEKKCVLCGIIKDSRSKKLAGELGAGCSDTLLCSYLLQENERTKELGYFEGKHPNGDVAELGRQVKVFYLRPSRNDLPLRIEVLGCDIDSAASLVCTLSSLSENYAYPAALIEADLRAALDPGELEAIESSLSALSGMKPLRRNSRPFR
jgi:hypothetical protein